MRLLRQPWEEGRRAWGHGYPCTPATREHCSHQQLEAWKRFNPLQGRAKITWVSGTAGPAVPAVLPRKTAFKDPTYLCLSPCLSGVARLAEGSHVHR